ncbi:MAG TPA: ABC transporter ATP-binding protein [Iamia sp.]
MSLVEVQDLVAGYDGVPAVRGLTLHVDAGEVVALLGPNGAGKTTTLLTLAGVLPKISGSVRVLDHDVTAERPHLLARRGLGLVPEDRGVFHQLTVAENLRLGQRPRSSVRASDVLDLFPALRPLLHRRCGLLSGGEQQMLALAKALVADPKVLMIDEMSLGLAPIVVEGLLPIARTMATERGTAVLLVEQHVHLALRCSDRAYVLSHGNLVLARPSRDLLQDPALLERSYLGDGPARVDR